MADTTTTNLGLTKPEVGVSTTWPTSLNSNFDAVDALFSAGPVLKVENGGTGADTQADAANAILPTQTADAVLVSDGSDVSFTRDVSLKTVRSDVASVTYSATPDFDMSAGTAFTLTLTGNAAATMSNPAEGQRVVTKIVQDATGGRTFSWPAEFLGGMEIGLDANAVSIQEWVCFDGANYEAVSMGVLR
jgi:hypothetical protein